MKTIKHLQAAFLSFIIVTGASGQEGNFRVRINTEKEGKETLVDTTFSSKAALENYMQSQGHAIPRVPPVPPRPPKGPDAPIPPAPPTPPGFRPLPELPQLVKISIPGDLPELPDLKSLMIEIENIELSEDEKEKMRNELKKASKELKRSSKEFEKIRNEYGEVIIQREFADGNNEKYIISEFRKGSPCDSNLKKYVIISIDEKNDEKIIKEKEKLNRENDVQEITLPAEKNEQVPSSASSKEESKNESVRIVQEDFKLKASDLKIFPNPTHGKITVSFVAEQPGEIEVRLLDGNGRVVIDEMVQTTETGAFSREYNISGKANGTYLLQLRQGNLWRHDKIILK